jgi:hypothetical protein
VPQGFPLTSIREINVLLSITLPNIVDVREVAVGKSLDQVILSLFVTFYITPLVKRAPPLNKKNPTTSTWHHQRRTISLFFMTMNLVIAWR